MASPVANSPSSPTLSDTLPTTPTRSGTLLHPDAIFTGDQSPHGSSGASLATPHAKTSADDEEEEEITETKIIGVTESGVIRKRSFKRKLTKEERDKRGYGNDRDEYEKIAERVMGERMISSALESLLARGKMLSFMHGDCLALLDKWEQRRQERMLRRFNQERVFLLAVAVVSVALLITCWLIWIWLV